MLTILFLIVTLGPAPWDTHMLALEYQNYDSCAYALKRFTEIGGVGAEAGRTVLGGISSTGLCLSK
jgi:hypothetical protein